MSEIPINSSLRNAEVIRCHAVWQNVDEVARKTGANGFARHIDAASHYDVELGSRIERARGHTDGQTHTRYLRPGNIVDVTMAGKDDRTHGVDHAGNRLVGGIDAEPAAGHVAVTIAAGIIRQPVQNRGIETIIMREREAVNVGGVRQKTREVVGQKGHPFDRHIGGTINPQEGILTGAEAASFTRHRGIVDWRVARSQRAVVTGIVHISSVAIPSINHDFNIGVVGRRDRIAVGRSAWLRIAVNGNPVLLVNERKTGWRHLEEMRARARDVEGDGVARTAISDGPIQGARGADVADPVIFDGDCNCCRIRGDNERQEN